ncbi:MAG: ATP-dependent DNA helicase [Candidatus Thermoplasmatota archaeon]|nr:ATP-dependent DNA helicase [Candidatus Thermoplasmatota archaeon]
MEFFPYKPRPHQQAIVTTIAQAFQNRSHLVIESGTGTGKTICALSAALDYGLAHGKKIVYITRTNAQQQQVIKELRAIRSKCKQSTSQIEKLIGVGIQGRSNMCPHAQRDEELSGGTSEELSRFCSNEKKKTRNSNKGCPYYRNFVNEKIELEQMMKWIRDELPTAETFIDHCEKKMICPYELNKKIVRDVTVVVVPFIYVFDITIRNMLFDWMGVAEEDVLLIVDEAHNLPDYLRELFSTQLSTWMLRNCGYEARDFGNPSIANGKSTIAQFCKTVEDIIRELRDSYVYSILEDGIRKGTSSKTDAFLPKNEFLNEITQRVSISQKQLQDLVEDLIAYGEKIQDAKQKQNKLPRSYLHKLGLFLDFWMNIALDQYAKLIVDDAEGKNPRIEAYCLDPSVGTGILSKFHGSIHMSGTLEPLEEYRDSMGLSQSTTLISFPSPFSKQNKKLFFVDDVTTKYDELVRDPQITDRLWQYISTICNTFSQNTMIFFPSFNILSMFRRNNDFSKIQRLLFLEEQKMSQSALIDLIDDFKSCGDTNGDGAALFSVMGGRISEGMDFPAEQLEIAVIVGIPYPKPTARQRGLQQYYDMKFRKGWAYTVEAPAARKMLQSIGRLIRDETDRGVAVILDRRAARFKKYFRDLTLTDDLLFEMKNFFLK